MTIAVDFDGVIHKYSQGWGDGTIYDPPMPGALDGLRALMEADSVFVFTTRDRHQVTNWLTGHGLDAIADSPATARVFWNERGRLLVTDRKYPAVAYLDDRAVRFVDWHQAITDLQPKPAPEEQERQRPTPFECTRQNPCNTCAVCWR